MTDLISTDPSEDNDSTTSVSCTIEEINSSSACNEPEKILEQLKQEEEKVIFSASCQSEAQELVRQRQETINLLQEQISALSSQQNIFTNLKNQLSNTDVSKILAANQNHFQEVKNIIKEIQYQMMKIQQDSPSHSTHFSLSTKQLLKISLIISLPIILGIALATGAILYVLQRLFG